MERRSSERVREVLTVLYVFAIASVELIGKHPDFATPYFQERFGTLAQAMFTLFQASPARTLCKVDLQFILISNVVLSTQPDPAGHY